MKKKLMIVASFLVISATTGWVIKYRSQSAPTQASAIWVQATSVKETSLPLEANAIGTLVARSVEITPEIAGHVKEILFRDGTFVTKGTPLIQLDDSIYKAKYESTKAQLIASENDFKRKASLGKMGIITKPAIDQAEADLKEKKANAEENSVTLNKMKLIAPFDGMVGKSKVNPGDYITTGQSVVTLTDTQHLRVEYNIPEKYRPALKLGQVVKITTSTYPGKVFIGKVAF